MLHGRDAERAYLASLLAAASEGRAGIVLVHGEPGMGKSALLDDAAAQAADVRVLRTAGLEAESALAFAGLHRLVRPALNGLEAVPAPQRRALRVAFGEEEGDRIDPFLVALGTLTLLAELAEAQPVLCLVDDLQWLDAASRDALLFVARRLLAEPVTMVFAARDDETHPVPGLSDIPELPLAALSPTAVRSLVEERTGTPIADHVLTELTARTGGNPLAVVEAPAQLAPGQLTGTEVLPQGLPLSARMERTFLDRCRRLSPEAQTLMLLAAIDDSLRLAELMRAGRALGVADVAFAEVETSGLLLVDGDLVHVRHPLVRSALYQSATASERRAAHVALADALARVDATVNGTGPGDDTDRGTWHRAAAADGPDEAVAAQLAALGARAESRGGSAAAAAAYERAAHLSIRDDARAQRLFAAARNAYATGRIERTDALLKTARPIADDRPLRAAIDRLRGRIEVAAGSAMDAHRFFIIAARDVAAESPVQALEMAAYAGVLHSHGIDSGLALPPGTLSTQPTPDDPPRVRCLKLLLEATRKEAEHDWGGAIAVLRTALGDGMAAEDRDVWANLGNMALHLGDDAAHRSYFAAMLAAARTDGAVMEVLYALHRLCFSQYAGGDWASVRRSADEAVSLARSIGQPAQTGTPLAWLTMLAALQGRDDYDELLTESTGLLTGRHLGVMDGFVADVLRWAQATRASHAGDHAEALHHFTKMHDGVVTRLAAAPRILAAVQASDPAQAQVWTEEMERFATASRLPWAQAVACYGRALLADTPEAVALFEASLRHHEAAQRPYDTACAQLAFGERLRRAGRRIEARQHLKRSFDTFRDLAAEPLAERAATELRASGETARKRDPSTLVQLTPTELRIAQLVSQGMSNKEVAEVCWISPRTVAFHLRNVFSKTGVTSRGELAHLGLGEPEVGGPAEPQAAPAS
ncbi:helix-turn-helix transcriptional regulator [Nocardioides caldifontis]|uniref:helix-turn-helix transcriptional regulator n=1 Tax=Nocardioides caldifontis TaxID=2588938 RepID=UPI0011E02A5E|nr:LuxR family transcriptional regulator [Nocardioides caldifontis]